MGEPVRTMAPMEGEASRVRRAALSSVMRGVERALRDLGRLRVTGGVSGWYISGEVWKGEGG